LSGKRSQALAGTDFEQNRAILVEQGLDVVREPDRVAELTDPIAWIDCVGVGQPAPSEVAGYWDSWRTELHAAPFVLETSQHWIKQRRVRSAVQGNLAYLDAVGDEGLGDRRYLGGRPRDNAQEH